MAIKRKTRTTRKLTFRSQANIYLSTALAYYEHGNMEKADQEAVKLFYFLQKHGFPVAIAAAPCDDSNPAAGKRPCAHANAGNGK